MNSFKTERRQAKILSVLKYRQPTLKMVLENIADPHNVSAILRTCDAAGIPKVSLLYTVEPFPRVGKKSSASAMKWIEREKFKTVEDCYGALKQQGFKIYTSTLDSEAEDLYNLDLTEPSAVILGNEHRGVSEETLAVTDKKFYIPMFGMVQSLNVSVAAAVIIYEAMRQRRLKGMYSSGPELNPEIETLLADWNRK